MEKGGNNQNEQPARPFRYEFDGEEYLTTPDGLAQFTFKAPNEYFNFIEAVPIPDDREGSRDIHYIYAASERLTYNGLAQYIKRHKATQLLYLDGPDEADQKRFWKRQLRDLRPRKYLPKSWEDEADDYLGDYGF